MKTRMSIYVCGPYTQGNVEENVERAIGFCDLLLMQGFAPICPHLSHFWDLRFKHPYDTWMELDYAYILGSDAVLWDQKFLPGPSKGAQLEKDFCFENNIPFFESVDNLIQYRDFMNIPVTTEFKGVTTEYHRYFPYEIEKIKKDRENTELKPHVMVPYDDPTRYDILKV